MRQNIGETVLKIFLLEMAVRTHFYYTFWFRLHPLTLRIYPVLYAISLWNIPYMRWYDVHLGSGQLSGIALLCGLDDRGFESRQGLGIFFLTTASRPALEPTQPQIQWVPGALSLGVKRLGREDDHSPLFSAEVKNAWSYTCTPQYAFMAWCSVKVQGRLYLYLVFVRTTVVFWTWEGMTKEMQNITASFHVPESKE
jgi:hypothetical protein